MFLAGNENFGRATVLRTMSYSPYVKNSSSISNKIRELASGLKTGMDVGKFINPRIHAVGFNDTSLRLENVLMQ